MFTLGLPEAATYFVAKRGESARQILQTSITWIGTAGIVVTVLLAIFAGYISTDSSVATLIRIGSLGIAPSLIVAVLRGVAAGQSRWLAISVESMSSSAARLVVVGGLALSGQLTPMSATIAISATTFIGGLVYLRGRRPGKSPGPLLESRSVARFALGVWGGSLTGVMLTYLDQVLMTPMASARELGIYSTSVSISFVVIAFNAAVRTVTVSTQSSKLDAGQLGRSARISTLVTVAVGVVTAAAAPWLVPVVFGGDFRAAVPVLEVLVLAAVLGNPGSIAGSGLIAGGRPALRSLSLAVALCVNASLIWVLVPPFGALGAALATVGGNVVAGYLNIAWLWFFMRIRPGLFLSPQRSDFLAVRDAFGSVLARVGRLVGVAKL